MFNGEAASLNAMRAPARCAQHEAFELSSENNALRLTEQIKKGGMPSFVEIFNEEKNLFAVYVGPFLSEDDILNNIDTIKKLSESNQGEVQPWKL